MHDEHMMPGFSTPYRYDTYTATQTYSHVNQDGYEQEIMRNEITHTVHVSGDLWYYRCTKTGCTTTVEHLLPGQ